MVVPAAIVGRSTKRATAGALYVAERPGVVVLDLVGAQTVVVAIAHHGRALANIERSLVERLT